MLGPMLRGLLMASPSITSAIAVEGFKRFVDQNNELLRCGGAYIKLNRLNYFQGVQSIEAILSDNAPDPDLVQKLGIIF